MINDLKSSLKRSFDEPNYLYLLIAILTLILNGAIALKFEHLHILMDISYALVIFLGPFYSSSNFKSFFGHFLLGIAVFILYFINIHQTFDTSFYGPSLTLLFYYLLLHKLINYVWKEDEVNFNIMLAAVCGYLVLGITGGIVFIFINTNIPGAFTISQESGTYDFIYFSFITLTSLGYGDISPVDPLAKMTAILVSVGGQLYLAIILALIVSKYLIKQSQQ